MDSAIKATVFIPTWFGINYIDDLLDAVVNQKLDQSFEILIYDTSSTDGTQEVIKKYVDAYKNIRWKVLTKEEYGHGRTRQRAAVDAKGEIVVYLSQDAIPTHDRWLYEMIKPFEISEQIVAVMGKQQPRNNAFPLLKYEIQRVFSSFGPDLGTSIFYNDYFVENQGQYDFISFYSDVNSAARKRTLMSGISYQDVDYAEDQLLGRDIINNGLIKAFAPRGSVIHSNDMQLREYALRMFDETTGLRRLGIIVEHPSLTVCTKLIARGIASDSIRIIYDQDYSWLRKLYWLVINPLYHFEKWRGVRRGTRAHLDDTTLRSYSLEHRKQVKFDKSD